MALRCTTGDGAREKAAILWMRDCGKTTGGAEPRPYGEAKDSVAVEGQKQGHAVLPIQRKSPDPFSIQRKAFFIMIAALCECFRFAADF